MENIKDRYGNSLDSKTFKAYLHTPEWVTSLLYPEDKIILESLGRDYFADWYAMGGEDTHKYFDFYFWLTKHERRRREFERWYTKMFVQRNCGCFWRRIRSIPARHRGRLPLWQS